MAVYALIKSISQGHAAQQQNNVANDCPQHEEDNHGPDGVPEQLGLDEAAQREGDGDLDEVDAGGPGENGVDKGEQVEPDDLGVRERRLVAAKAVPCKDEDGNEAS